MREEVRQWPWLVTVLGMTLVASVMTGCSVLPGMGCGSPDEAVADELMSHAKTDFMAGDTRIAEVEFKDAAQGPLPAELRRYGATDIVVIYAVAQFADAASPELGGVYGANTFVVDADGQPVGVVGPVAQRHFDVPAPDDSGWDTWAQRVDRSPEAIDFRACVKK